MIITSPKDSEEIVDVAFDFALDADGVAINAGSPAVTATVIQGADPDVANTLQGAPTIDGAVVYQRFRAGVHGALYKLRCKVTLADGRVLVLVCAVPVRDE